MKILCILIVVFLGMTLSAPSANDLAMQNPDKDMNANHILGRELISRMKVVIEK